MSKISFDNYAKKAEKLKDTLQVAGRLPTQRNSERLIVRDIIKKLKISPLDNCLDIGCNVGNILIPLSFMVNSITGIDNASCVTRLQQRYDGDNIILVKGDFMDHDFHDQSFDKIIIYSVLHYLGKDEVEPFIKKALSVLAPGGCMILGDIPNISLKQRFCESEYGIKFQKEWELLNKNTQYEKADITSRQDLDLAIFDDQRIISILTFIRGLGFNAFVLPQNHDLPFGNTREDIVIERPA